MFFDPLYLPRNEFSGFAIPVTFYRSCNPIQHLDLRNFHFSMVKEGGENGGSIDNAVATPGNPKGVDSGLGTTPIRITSAGRNSLANTDGPGVPLGL